MPTRTEIRLMIKREYAKDRLGFARICFDYILDFVRQPRIKLTISLAGISHTLAGEVQLQSKPEDTVPCNFRQPNFLSILRKRNNRAYSTSAL
jgi:hypothetical protein